jgi:hypothetical protein
MIVKQNGNEEQRIQWRSLQKMQRRYIVPNRCRWVLERSVRWRGAGFGTREDWVLRKLRNLTKTKMEGAESRRWESKREEVEKSFMNNRARRNRELEIIVCVGVKNFKHLIWSKGCNLTLSSLRIKIPLTWKFPYIYMLI